MPPATASVRALIRSAASIFGNVKWRARSRFGFVYGGGGGGQIAGGTGSGSGGSVRGLGLGLGLGRRLLGRSGARERAELVDLALKRVQLALDGVEPVVDGVHASSRGSS